MKIFLANMPWAKDGRQGVRAGSRWPHLKDDPESNYLPFPFFLAYSTSALEGKGFDVCLCDAICEELSDEAFINNVAAYRPDMVVIETSTVSLDDDLAFIKRLEKRFFTVLCGPDVNMHKPQFLKENTNIDCVIKGEYEFALLDVAQCMKDKKELSTIAGINYRGSDGGIYINQSRTLGDINTLPWPKREKRFMERYIDSPGAMPFPTVQMLASRGCPYECLFCLWPQVMFGGRTYRVRDPKDVLDEMEEMVHEYQFKSIYFDDDTFGLKNEWAHQFCDLFLERNKRRRINVPWAMMTRPDVMDEALLKKLKETGLWAVKYGMESANQQLVNNIKKNLDIEYAKNIIKKTHVLGIKTHLTFTFGLPGETKKTVRETIKTAMALNPYTIQFSVTTPFPGTKYYDTMSASGQLLSKKWSDYDGNTTSVIRTDALGPEELVCARARAYKKWNRHCKIRNIKDKIFNKFK